MKAILISKTAKLLEELRRAVEAEGYKVAQALLRKGGQPLSKLLHGIDGNLLIVDGASSRPEDDFPEIEAITGEHPSMVVIVLSANRESEVLLAAMHAGIREVLPSPPDIADIAAALRRVAQRGPATTSKGRRARVIGFMPCKGGSGATFIATNVAYLLAAEFGEKTLLVDLDLQYGDASYFVTNGAGKSDIGDLAKQIDRLDAKLLTASVHNVAPNFSLLSAPTDPEAALSIRASHLEKILSLATDNYDFVVLDVERMLDPALGVKALDMTDTVFVVTQALVPYVRNAKHLVDVLRSLGSPEGKLHLVVNRYEKHGAVELEQIEKIVGLKVNRTVPNSFVDVAQSINTGLPLAKVNANNPVVHSLREFASELSGKQAPGRFGWFGRLIGNQS